MPVQPRITLHALWVLMLIACVWSRQGEGAETLPFVLGAPFQVPRALELNDDDRRWLKERKVLRVGIPIADYEPIDITTDQNRYQGISADYLSLISAKLSLPIKITGFSRREDEIAALLAGEVDVLTGANGYERAFSGLSFSNDYMPDRSVVVGRKVDTPLRSTLHGKRVALLDGYADANDVHKAYPDSQIVLAPTLRSGMEALAQGDVDAFIGNEVIVRSYSALRPFLGLRVQFESLLPPSGLSFAMRRSDDRLQTLMNRALGDLDESVTREIHRRWTVGLGDDVVDQRIRLSPSEQQWMRRHPQVKVASTLHPPYIYKDENGQWVGLNIDVLDKISRMTGLIFVHEAMPSTQVALDTLSAGKADMNTTLAETPERRELLNFGYAYGGNNWVYIVRDDEESPVMLSDLSGKILAMPARHALLGGIQRDYPQIRLELVQTYAQARRRVEAGDAHATIQNEAGAWAAPLGKLKVGRGVEGLWSPDRFAVVKTQPELLSILNKALDEFPVAELRSIRMKWLGSMKPETSVWKKIPSPVYWLLGGVALSALLSLLWNRRLKAQVAQRERAEGQLNDQLVFTRALLDGLPDPIYVRDLQGRLMACNRRYEDSLGISFEQLNGRRLIDIDLLPRESVEKMHAAYMTLLRTQEPVKDHQSLTLLDRRIEAFQWMVPFYRANGELQGLVGGWTDLTESRRIEQELITARQQPESAPP